MPFSFQNEIFHSNLDINYVFIEGKVCKDYLIVVFSGFNSPDSKIQHTYNYMRTLENLDCNKLFILDNYGPRGCYYLGRGMSHDVENSVISLIDHISKKYRVNNNKIITAGSSKGGTAALYYSLKYKFGYVICGAPQIFIGNYTRYVTRETYDYLIGEEEEGLSLNKLNNLIFDQLGNKSETIIFLLTSEKDWQYEKHVLPFLKKIDTNQNKVILDIDNRIREHTNVADFFPNYLINNILKIIYGVEIFDNGIQRFPDKIIIDYRIINKNNDSKIKLLCIAQNQDGVIEYCENDFERFTYVPNSPGLYEFYIELSISSKKFYSQSFGKQLLGGALFDFLGYEFQIESDDLTFSIKVNERDELKYAYYIVKDGKIEEKIWYSKNKSIRRKIDGPGRYEIRYFIKMSDEKIIADRTHTIVNLNNN